MDLPEAPRQRHDAEQVPLRGVLAAGGAEGRREGSGPYMLPVWGGGGV